MYISQVALGSGVLAFAVLILAVIYLVVVLLRQKKEKREDVAPYQTTAHIIDHAHKRAQDIIDRAIEHSEETLYQTEFLKSELIQHGEESIQEVVNHIVELLNRDGVQFDSKYQDLFDTLQKRYQERINEAMTQLEKAATDELKSFREQVIKGTLGSQVKMDEQIEKELEIAKEEIATYKKEKLRKIDAQIATMLESIIQEVLGRAIPLKEHEALILDALENAKREGMFKTEEKKD